VVVSRPLILCYHGLSSTWRSSLAIPVERLESQLSKLRRRGWTGLTFREAERRRSAGTLPEKSVVVTFDDGYASTLDARPVLDELGFPATVFVVTRFVDSGNPLTWDGIGHWAVSESASELRTLVWSDLVELADAGWEVGSHTVTHPRLVDVDDATLEDELVESRERIAAQLGSCDTIAYPYGLADRRVAAAAARAGYRAACTLSSFAADEPHLRPRIGMYPSDGPVRSSLKLFRHATGMRVRLGSALAGVVER